MTEATIADDVQAFKDLRKYETSDEWKALDAELDTRINETEQKIMWSRWDANIIKSVHCVMWAREELYKGFMDKITDKKAEHLKKVLEGEMDAILSQILYKVVDDIGTSLDKPVFSVTDLLRFDIKSFYYLKSLLRNTIDTLDPKKKGTKDTMNPYNEDYSNEVTENAPEETETPLPEENT